MCFQASLATFEKLVFFVLPEHEIPGGLLQRHSQQNPAACTSMMFILLIRNQSRLCARRGLDSQASERTLWAQRRVCKLWLKHRHRDYKTAGKLHPKPSHCCSEAAWQSPGRAVYCEGCWSSGCRLFHCHCLICWLQFMDVFLPSSDQVKKNKPPQKTPLWFEFEVSWHVLVRAKYRESKP